MFEHIMVSLDGTPLAEQALSPAVSLARARSRRLRWRAGDLRPYEPSATALHDGARSGPTSGQE